MASEMHDSLPRSPSRSPFWIIVAVVGLATLGFSLWMRTVTPAREGLETGAAAPPIQVGGWIRWEGDGGSGEGFDYHDGPDYPHDLDGQVRVVHAWFPECPYCYQEAPELIELEQEFSERGVQFVGLTFRDAGQLPAIQDFLRQTRLPWWNGYGALGTLRRFEANYFPAAWVIDSAGRIVWNRDTSPLTLREGIEAALASES